MLVASPGMAIRRLVVSNCGLDAAALLALAGAHWPLEELDIGHNDFSAAAAGPALAALSRHAGLLRLDVSMCSLSPANFKAIIEGTWPALTSLTATEACTGDMGDRALDFSAASFAGFPKLEALNMASVKLGEEGARALASRRWSHLRMLNMNKTRLQERGWATIARGEWPALQQLSLTSFDVPGIFTLDDARRWAPALLELHRPY